MSDTTARLRLPFILPGQSQKELFHNEALTSIDAVLHAAVEEMPRNAPPESPSEGQAWIVGTNPTGDWAAKEDKLALWSNGGWRFVDPMAGMSVWVRSAGYWIHWLGSTWSNGEYPVTSLTVNGKKVVGERQSALPSPSGGTIIDEEARGAITAIIATLKSHGLVE